MNTIHVLRDFSFLATVAAVLVSEKMTTTGLLEAVFNGLL